MSNRTNVLRSLAHHVDSGRIALSLIVLAMMMIASSVRAQCATSSSQAPAAKPSAWFGSTVGLSGDRAIAGWLDTRSAVVLRHVSDALPWVPEAVLAPLAGNADDLFGAGVAIDGDTAAVGASEDNEQGGHAGAVYVYQRDPKTSKWTQQAKLLASDGAPGGHFGTSIAIDRDRIIVGASGPLGSTLHGAYIFHRDPDTLIWEQEQKLIASGVPTPYVVWSVGISDGVAVMHTYKDCYCEEWLVNIVVFAQNPDSRIWSQEFIIPTPEYTAGFGASMALDHDVLIVGGLHFYSQLGVTAAYVYRRNPDSHDWAFETELLGSMTPTDEVWLARWVDVSGDTVAFGDINDTNGGAQLGSVFLHQFDPSTGQWPLLAKLTAPVGAEPDNAFGFGVHLSDGRLVVSAPDPWQHVNPGSIYFFNLEGPDCNANGICDSIDIGSGASLDLNADGVPDECIPPTCAADIAPSGGDGQVSVDDLLAVLAAWGSSNPEANVVSPPAIDMDDLLAVINAWGACP